MRLSAGTSARLGASWDGRGTNFALFSANAQKVELCLFDPQGRRELERIELPERTEDVWHGYLNDVSPGQRYGYRVHGPYEPEHGHRFNANKLLLDPYAKRLAGRLVWSDAHFAYRTGSAREDLSFDRRDNARGMPKAVVVDESFNWGRREMRPITPPRATIWARRCHPAASTTPPTTGLSRTIRGSTTISPAAAARSTLSIRACCKW